MSEPEKTAEQPKKEFVEEALITKTHQFSLGKVESTVGRMPIRNEKGEIDAQMFFVAYTLAPEKGKKRPLIFAFNGGPGSPSLWLHLGALGPKVIPMHNDGELPKPPYRLSDNPHTWLEHADIVFIDPIGTGFSEAKDDEIGATYWGMKGDIESVSQFIQSYLGRFKRFDCPLYLAGESYGTTRAAGVANYLVQRGVAFNGVILVSVAMNFATLDDYQGNDLSTLLFLPSFAATAWYHGKLKAKSLPSLLKEAEEFVMGEYATALLQGDRLKNREGIAQKVAEFTGCSEKFVHESNLRVHIMRFVKELRRDEGLTVGRLDSRITGIERDQGAEQIDHDPSMSAISPPYQMTLNQYVRETLGYETDKEYVVFRGIKKPWKWDMPEQGPPDTSAELAQALMRNPHMRVFVASGYYDLATPYFATEHTFAHMNLPAAVRKNVIFGYYEAGHMMYTHTECLKQLKVDVDAFIKGS